MYITTNKIKMYIITKNENVLLQIKNNEKHVDMFIS